jgi:4-amino-4-deoxy-L-arabinose transferase-like glycosyltransferase
MHRCLILMVLLAALALRLWGLGTQSLWLDEAYSSVVAQKPPGELLRAQLADSSPPLYYFILKFFISLGGASESVLRLPSALSGVLTVVLLIWWLRRRGEALAGVFAGVFLAVSPLHLYYSQESRMYALFALLCLVSFIGFERYLVEGGRGWAATWGLSLLAAWYTHNYAVFLLATHAVAVLAWWRLRPENGRSFRRVACYVLVGVLLAGGPWAFVMWKQVRADHSPGHQVPTIEETVRSAIYLTVKSWSSPWWPGKHVFLVLGMGSALALAAFGVRRGLSRQRGARERLWYLFPLFGLLPGFLGWAVSFVRPVFMAGRYESCVLPFVALAVGRGLVELLRFNLPEKFTPRMILMVLRLVLVIGLCASLGLEHLNYRLNYVKSRDRTVAEWLAERLHPGDVVVAGQLSGTPLLHYLPRFLPGGRADLPPIYRLPKSELGWNRRIAYHGPEEYVRTEFQAALDFIRRHEPWAVFFLEPERLPWVAGFTAELAPLFGEHYTLQVPDADNQDQVQRLHLFTEPVEWTARRLQEERWSEERP